VSDMNSVVLVGRLTRDPELRYTPQGAAVAELGLAVNRRFVKKDGEKVEEVSFIDVVAWNRLAETMAEYLKKGRQVVLLGSLVQERWQDKESGQPRSRIRVQAQSVQFLGGGSKDGHVETSHEEVPAEEPLVVPDEPPARPPARSAPQRGRTAARR
jgi:single-strand DNA-binding protein